jgi:hypothetical protein
MCRTLLLLGVSLSLLAVEAAFAGSNTTVYVCNGKDGKVYTDRPCGADEQTVTTKSYHSDPAAHGDGSQPRCPQKQTPRVFRT